MKANKCLAAILCVLKLVDCAMEPFIVGGIKATITDFPHSVFLSIQCVKKQVHASSWICGGSILNQRIVMTAAHCLEGCLSQSIVHANVGSENFNEAETFSVRSFVTHVDYDSDTSEADIALVKLSKRLQFSSKVKRVALMRRPPYNENAFVAGWGLVDEEKKILSPHLKYLDQEVYSREYCNRLLQLVPEGCICASSKNYSQFPSSGDSGSALIVREYIQIGIVSFKIPEFSPNMIVYTDVGKFYNWIRVNAKRLQCN